MLVRQRLASRVRQLKELAQRGLGGAEGRAWKALRAVHGRFPRALRRLNDTDTIQPLLDRYSSAHKGDLFFVQVGSNDGVSNDPIRQYVLRDGWNGVLVEPMEYLFEQLRKNYAGTEGLGFENSAIDESNAPREFWFMRPPDKEGDLPPWWAQIGSFDKTNVLHWSDRYPAMKQHLTSRLVSCVSMQALLAKHGIERLDVLHVDAEGFDFEVIKQLDFDRFQPDLILYEYKALGEQRSVCRRFLTERGYHLVSFDGDTLAVRKTARLDPHE